MRESIGSTFLYNIMFIFIIIVFGLVTATLSYYKGFKVNTHILYSIQKFEGYNSLARKEINNYLNGIGYTVDSSGQRDCPNTKSGLSVVRATDNVNHLYCVYYEPDDTGAKEKRETNGLKRRYYNYSVMSYIYVDLPIVGSFKVPVYSKGERIYKFNDGQR